MTSDLAPARLVVSWWQRLRSWRLPIGPHADCITPYEADERLRAALNTLVKSWWDHDNAQRSYIAVLRQQLHDVGVVPADAPLIRPVPTSIPSGGVPRLG